MSEDVDKLVDDHWEYVYGLLNSDDTWGIEFIRYIYTTAMLHGIKHGEENASS